MRCWRPAALSLLSAAPQLVLPLWLQVRLLLGSLLHNRLRLCCGIEAWGISPTCEL